MACRDGGLATTEWREPASSDRLPIHRSESPTGYSSAGCSPAEPASASPVTNNSNLIPVQRGNENPLRDFHYRDAVQAALVAPAAKRGCHLYFARRVPFLSCADIGV